jgi:hypothetical protein
MKHLLFIFGIFALTSCATIEPATSYYFSPRNNVEELGELQMIIERQGYSIITVENCCTPIYVEGKLPKIEIPSKCYLWKQSDDKYHFVVDNRRYEIDTEKTNLII